MPSSTARVVAAEPSSPVLDLTERESLRATCQSALDRARSSGQQTLMSWAKSLPAADPVALWGRGRDWTQRSLLWQSAWSHGSIVAFGTAHDLPGRGADRVSAVRRQWADLSRDVVTGGAADILPGGGPLALGGFSFSAAEGHGAGRLPDALLWVPALQVRTGPAAPETAELHLNATLFPDSDAEQVAKELAHLADLCLLDDAVRPTTPAAAARSFTRTEVPGSEEWKDLVRRATGRILVGDFEKVVLARELRVTASEPFDVPATVQRLREANPGTTLFAVDHGDHTFLGATPEYLTRVEGRTVHALGLAGTTPRGATPEQDRELERELVESPKLQHEHDVVVQVIRDSLSGFCADVTAATPPGVLKLANVQHLSTDVSGRLADDATTGILDLVECLHPTPALGGHPRKEALGWLAENEGFDRSWYAGLVGWSDPAGQGEFAVAIRSALLCHTSASLYAGCGLVADSDPEVEYAETCAKLRAMMSALEIE